MNVHGKSLTAYKLKLKLNQNRAEHGISSSSSSNNSTNIVSKKYVKIRYSVYKSKSFGPHWWYCFPLCDISPKSMGARMPRVILCKINKQTKPKSTSFATFLNGSLFLDERGFGWFLLFVSSCCYCWFCTCSFHVEMIFIWKFISRQLVWWWW